MAKKKEGEKAKLKEEEEKAKLKEEEEKAKKREPSLPLEDQPSPKMLKRFHSSDSDRMSVDGAGSSQPGPAQASQPMGVDKESKDIS